MLLFNHGSTGAGTIALSTTMRPSRQAQFFVERGFAVLAPMRRGRGASGGVHQEYEGTCEPDVLGTGLARAIEDVDAAMAYLRVQPWADPGRLWIAGQSEEDGYYSPTWIRRYHDAFVQAGGITTFHLFPAFGGNGHRLVDHVERWATAVDDFLRRLNLVSR